MAAADSQPSDVAFEFTAVVASNNDLPALLSGTSDSEDSLNARICDELGLGRSLRAVAQGLRLP
jgi:hypothetical protein